MIAHDRPELIRRVILAGTGPAGGEGISAVGAVVQHAIQKAGTDQKHPKQFLFFSQTRLGQQAADAFLQRLSARKENRDTAISNETTQAQLNAITNWGNGLDSWEAAERHQAAGPRCQRRQRHHGPDEQFGCALPNALLSIFRMPVTARSFSITGEFVEQARQFFEN